MNGTPFGGFDETSTQTRASGWRAGDLFLVLPLAALMALPLLEMGLRRFHGGLAGSTTFVQHFTLIIGMLGGAIAARDGRLLSFSTLASFLKGRTLVV